MTSNSLCYYYIYFYVYFFDLEYSIKEFNLSIPNVFLVFFNETYIVYRWSGLTVQPELRLVSLADYEFIFHRIALSQPHSEPTLNNRHMLLQTFFKTLTGKKKIIHYLFLRFFYRLYVTRFESSQYFPSFSQHFC